MAHTIHDEGRWLTCTMEQTVTGEELIAIADELAVIEAALEQTPDRLTDLTAVTRLNLDFEAIENFQHVRAKMKLKNRVRSAVVAPKDVQFGFGRMAQMLAKHPQIEFEAFRTRAEAEAWLGTGKLK